MKYHFQKRKTRFEIEVSGDGRTTAHGGVLLIDQFARDLGLWKKISSIACLDPRTRKTAGYEPLALVCQLVFMLVDGGCSLADAERIGCDKVFLESVGLDRAADQSTLGEWLRSASRESIEAMCAANSWLVREILSRCPPERILHAGGLEGWFDDSEIEVFGPHIEGARRNYNGDPALSWQTLWIGPLLLDQELGGFADVAACQRTFLDLHADVWSGRKSHFYADSGSSEAEMLAHLSEAGFTTWSVSYNRWTDKLRSLAAALPESAWGDAAERNGTTETYAWLKHAPGEEGAVRQFAACRWKPEGELFWHYAFVACESDPARTPREVFERHRLKGDFERHFSEVLTDLDLHHPPCLALNANRMFYAIASLAHNLLQGLKLLRLDDEQQSWRNRTIIRNVLVVPATEVVHANRRRLKICVPAGLLRWWRLFVEKYIPRRKRGERPVEDVSPPPSGG
jgi:hypothetical protein